MDISTTLGWEMFIHLGAWINIIPGMKEYNLAGRGSYELAGISPM